MTRVLSATDVAQRLNERFHDAAEALNQTDVLITPNAILDSCKFLKETPGLDFAFLTAITAVDYIEYFELIYHLLSMKHNHSVVLKTRLYERDEPTISSVTGVWRHYRGKELRNGPVAETGPLLEVRQGGHSDRVTYLTRLTRVRCSALPSVSETHRTP